MAHGWFDPKLTYEDIHAVIAAVELHGGPSAAAKALGKGEGSLSHALREARKLGIYPPSTRGPVPGRKAASKDFGYKRHLFIPDTQIRPGVPTDHIDWVAQAIVEYRPDVIVVAGDWWDMASLNGHSDPGALELEGKRFKDDIDCGNAAFALLCAPLEAELARPGNRWSPRLEFLEGNHEQRADRIARADPKWMGHVGTNHCQVRGFHWNKFLEVVEIDGVHYSHFFQNPHSHHPIGGTAINRLNRIGSTFVMGHVQGFDYGTKVTATGRLLHGVVSGSCYLHTEDYRGPQGERHFNGIQIFNEVRNGNFCIMPLSLQYLCRKYVGEELHTYMARKYPEGSWDYLEPL